LTKTPSKRRNKQEIKMGYQTYRSIGNATLIITHAPNGEEVEYQVQTAGGLRSCYFDRRDHAEALARAL
tara:strand:- start:536 stop:742 length:207 start_codon:yes stop_codon:yes gene_type:complete